MRSATPWGFILHPQQVAHLCVPACEQPETTVALAVPRGSVMRKSRRCRWVARPDGNRLYVLDGTSPLVQVFD